MTAMPGAPRSRSSRPLAVLSLDGGGVRGLSSLLILRRLLTLVTHELIKAGRIDEDSSTIAPQDVFDIAAGTSTGGLIVLMLVVLDMSVDECIEQYRVLSRQIFSEQRNIAKRVFGSDWSKYSGETLQKAVEDLLQLRKKPVNLMMRSGVQKNIMLGTILSHEQHRKQAIFFCTEECQHLPHERHVLRCDVELRHAARATSAAPSYFEEIDIQGLSFVDGGFGETNNPSFESRAHYGRKHEKTTPPMVMINIGTGTLPDDIDQDKIQKRPGWTKFVPNGFLKASGLIADLAKLATDSEGPAQKLRYWSEEHPEQLSFWRFSADTGIHAIKLDDWRAVGDAEGTGTIEDRTRTYLLKPAVIEELKQAAEKLAEVYAQRHPSTRKLSKVAVDAGENSNHLSTPLQENPSAVRMRQQLASLNLSPAPEAVPSLITGTEPSQSPGCSPPRTPDPERMMPPLISTGDNREILQGQGDQFELVDSLSPLPTSPVSLFRPTSKRAPSKKPKRASTYPPRSPRDVEP